MTAIYARQSVDKKDSISIEAQIALCRRRAEGETVEYADKGYSGKNIERPAFRQMMEAVERGGIDRLIVYRLDRISRSIADFSRIWEILDRRHVAFVSLNEQFDTAAPMGRAMVYIIMVFAQLERETIAQRVADSYRYRALQGGFMGGGVPYGYRRTGVEREGRRVPVLEPDPEQAGVVRRIYGWYLAGLNTHRVAARLNEQPVSVPAPGGGRWSPSAVRRILRGVRYAAASAESLEYLRERGVAVAGGTEHFDGTVGLSGFHPGESEGQTVVCAGLQPPIIPAAQWAAVQRRLDGAAGITSAAPRSSRASWLTGLLRCGECGHSFGLRRSFRGGREYRYYCCRGRTGGSACRNSRWLPAGELETAVETALLARLGAGLRAEPEFPAAEVPAPDPACADLQRRISAAGEEIRRLMENIGRGGAVVDRCLADRITALDAERQAARARLEALARRPDPAGGTGAEQTADRVCGIFRAAGPEDKSVMARLLIRRVEVPPAGGVRIICNF